ncbi:MAG: SDR family NAD(P)-dependent oxidoreductase [Paracoccus sp. (in: a-proteobacteria)]|nr:SDR family NAD(P)-dependent oxidoreductase [Paracoccus sp. (in: a-proteobacteria)]
MTHILITGGNRGIGQQMATQALARGWQVTVTSRGGDGPKGAAVLRLDVTDHAALGAAAAGLGAVDILVNNAGVNPGGAQDPLEMDFDLFAQVLAVNTLAPLAVAQAFLPNLRASGAGRILSISSQMSWMGYRKPDQIAYRASKAALNKVMQGLATRLEAEQIPVALIDPGWVRTDMGGPDADLEAAEVAGGILDVAAGLDMARTGAFLRYDGTAREF